MTTALPPPVRAVAGLAARTLDEARRLPNRLVSLPVLAAGAAMQASLRLQQEYAGLVARGDELILALRGRSDEAPPWATFDDDAAEGSPTGAPDTGRGGHSGVAPLLSPPDAEPSAFDLVQDTGAVADQAGAEPAATAPVPGSATAPVPGYEGWTVAQLRARLRRLSTEQLALLLAYEQAGRQRAPYATMLQNRLTATSKG